MCKDGGCVAAGQWKATGGDESGCPGALREAGLDPFEQDVPGCRGANVLARIDGDTDRYVVVGAHFDHLGKHGKKVFWGADDKESRLA